MLTMYPACFFKEENGYSVIFPDLNYLSTCGENFEQAMSMAVDCLAGYIYTSKECGEEIPRASALTSIDYIIVAKEIYGNETLPDCVINMVTVDVDSYAKAYFERAVKKTLTIPSWMNERAISMDLNFSQVLQEALLAKMQIRK